MDGKQAKTMADQIMAADKGRLKSQLGVLIKADIRLEEDAIRIHLGLRPKKRVGGVQVVWKYMGF